MDPVFFGIIIGAVPGIAGAAVSILGALSTYRDKRKAQSRQDDADAITQLTAVLNEVREDLERHKTDSRLERERLQREINDHKESARKAWESAEKAWAKVRQVENKMGALQGENHFLKEVVTRHGLQIDLVREEAHEAAVAVKSRKTDLQLTDGPPDTKDTVMEQ